MIYNDLLRKDPGTGKPKLIKTMDDENQWRNLVSDARISSN